jgi:hypothetical protein
MGPLLMPYFSACDRAVIETLQLDPNAKPTFELLKSCLIWADERPASISPDGYDKLCDLWIARSCLHRGQAIGSGSLDPVQLQRAWQEALDDKISWPGFHRLRLSPEDQAYFDACLRDVADPSYER